MSHLELIDNSETPEFAPNINHITLPPMLEIAPSTLKKMDNLAQAFGYPKDTIKNMDRFAKLCLGVADHYKKEAERIRDCKIAGINIEPPVSKTIDDIVPLSWYKRIRDDVKLGRTIAVRGPAGNGKSTGVKTVLTELGYTIYHMDCTDTVTADQLIGGLVPEPDGTGAIKMVFRPGVFAKAFSDPKGAIQLDEFDALDPRVALCLQSALHRAFQDKKRFLAAPDMEEGGIEAVGNCPIIVTMNTYGSGATREYVGRNAIDMASLDRFNSIIDTNYEHEEKIIQFAGYNKVNCEKIVSYAKQIRKKIDENQLRIIISTRRLIDIAESMEKLKINMRKAFQREFYERLEPMDIKTLHIDIEEINANEEDFVLRTMLEPTLPFEKLSAEDMMTIVSKVYNNNLASLEEELKFITKTVSKAG